MQEDNQLFCFHVSSSSWHVKPVVWKQAEQLARSADAAAAEEDGDNDDDDEDDAERLLEMSGINRKAWVS